MKHLLLDKIDSPLYGHVKLDGSKSISNRVLIIQALCEESFRIDHLASAMDTILLKKALDDDSNHYDVHHAGSSSRFLLSYLALQNGTQTLTGSEQLQKRPIGPLVDALKDLGAHISYLGESGFLPVQIDSPQWKNNNQVRIAGNISSQFITSLLLIAPYLSNGLSLEIEGKLVSRSYVRMTLEIMEYFGISHQWEDDIIRIETGKYLAKDFIVEADWSAASYYFSLVGSIPESSIYLHGLHQNSLQGDAIINTMLAKHGVSSNWEQDGSLALKHEEDRNPVFEYDFIECPDLAQTIITYCACNQIMGLYTGLETLKIKETNRIAALQTELRKVGMYLSLLPTKFSKQDNHEEKYILQGDLQLPLTLEVDTYHDHRMAMALSVFASKLPIKINNAQVVEKSYPDYWEDLDSLRT